MSEDFFPQGIASGTAFLARESESNALKGNIKLTHHTLLIAPRRYGKTSLARQVLNELKLPHEEINFYLSRTAISVERKIRDCIKHVLSKKLARSEQIFASLKNFFARSSKRWTFGFKGIAEIELTPENENDIADNIFTVLSLLDETMLNLDKKIVLFLDEIQEIDLLDEGKQIQGAIREFAQQSKNVVFIFSGSNRRLLHHMFDDDSMPLYELCERIKLERIDAEDYCKYLNKVAQETFGRVLDEVVLEAIFTISERHPKRIYNLCYQLWLTDIKGSFTTQDVQQCWDKFVQLRLDDTRSKLSKLNLSQLKVLILIALDFEQAMTGKQAQQKLDLSSAAITVAIKVLQEKDFIVRGDDNRFKFLDPLYKSVLSRYESQLVG